MPRGFVSWQPQVEFETVLSRCSIAGGTRPPVRCEAAASAASPPTATPIGNSAPGPPPGKTAARSYVYVQHTPAFLPLSIIGEESPASPALPGPAFSWTGVWPAGRFPRAGATKRRCGHARGIARRAGDQRQPGNPTERQGSARPHRRRDAGFAFRRPSRTRTALGRRWRGPGALSARAAPKV